MWSNEWRKKTARDLKIAHRLLSKRYGFMKAVKLVSTEKWECGELLVIPLNGDSVEVARAKAYFRNWKNHTDELEEVGADLLDNTPYYANDDKYLVVAM